jgi:protein-S-isoprenylcysteine O-methyltransferase Ste14
MVRDKTVLRLLGGTIVAALAVVATTADQNARLAIGLLVGLPSLVLTIIGRVQLGKSFSVMPEARALVTTGLYSRLQHPMYVFLDLFLAALIVVLGWSILIILWGALVIAQVIQARREEKVLAASFGADYEAYQRRTWF